MHDGILFGSGWYEPGPSKSSDPPGFTQTFVQQAINLYDALGRDAAVDFYSSPESVDGTWYVFLGEEESSALIANGAFPDLVGLTADQVRGPNGYPIGEVIAAVADEDGAWVDYTFTNPVSGNVETKHSWVILHDGILFGSGWYEPGPSKSSDPPGFTQTFVQQAINLYDALGRDAAVDFYSSPESVDGTWYVFLGEEESSALIANAAFPDLVGLTADQVRGPNGYPIGEVIAAVADEDGAWVDYTFTNPVSGNVETKHSWVILHDGILFGSGWYEPGPSKSSDPPGFTQTFVQQAINLYDALGRDAAVDFYSSPESVDGTWYVFLIGEDGVTFAHPNPRLIGRDPSLRVDATGYFYGDDLLSATEQGRWVDYVFENPETGESEQKHTWVVRHNGILFGSGWYEP